MRHDPKKDSGIRQENDVKQLTYASPICPACSSYIGGLLKRARALAAIIAPTTNSYKRLVPGCEAPVNLAYDLSPDEMKAVPSMPSSLEEALNAIEDDHAFLMKGDVFTEELLENYVSYKRKFEADAVRLRPHPYEFALYYDI